MTFTFLSDGIPIVYYGQEQYLHGSGDPVSGVILVLFAV